MKQRGSAVLLAAVFYLMTLVGGCQDQPTSAPEIKAPTAGAAGSLGKGGFDEFGYNYAANIFVGTADGVDRKIDGMVWGDATYANDHLVMKWSKAWDDARFNNAPWTPEAWEDNEWNGNVAGGSGTTDHCKIVWVGHLLQNSPYWRPGGMPIWGQFEIIFEQGKYTPGGQTEFLAKAHPAGYGLFK